MEIIFIYILKANGLLIFFWMFYKVFLQKETFYTINRWYFISTLLIAFILPLIYFTKIEEIVLNNAISSFDSNSVMVSNQTLAPIQQWYEHINWLLVLFIILAAISFIRIVLRVHHIAKMIQFITRLPVHNLNKTIRLSSKDTTVYSFYKWIVVPKEIVQNENYSLLLQHETIHLTQKHTFDLVLISFVIDFFWFNPFLKMLRKDMNLNLEFLVDAKMATTENSYLYQKSLLQYQQIHPVNELVNAFQATDLKKRILQLNTQKSNHMKKLKFLLATPALFTFFGLFQIETVAQITTLEVQDTEENYFLVRDNFTKDDFAKLTKNLKENYNIDFSVRNVKFDNNKIKSLDYTIRNKDLKISTSERNSDNNKNIDPFLIIVSPNNNKPFRVEKYDAKPKYSYTVDNELEPNFTITEEEWKDASWINKISTNQKVIYIIDGKKSSIGAAYTLNPKDILSINVHRDQETKAKFKEDVDNVVIIKTKKIKDITNLDKDLELLLSDRKAFDRIAAKYPIYVDNILLTKKELKKFDTKTIRSMYVDENKIEIKLTTKKSETETFSFNIANNDTGKPSDKILINGKESTQEELKKHIDEVNTKEPLRLRGSLFNNSQVNIFRINHNPQYRTIEETYVISKNGDGSNSKRTVYKDADGKVVKIEDSNDNQQLSNNKIVTSNLIYVVDGTKVLEDDFRSIHPNNIESITVLKDKVSKEKYNALFKDGILVITTKKNTKS
ncbi:hypothetical protein H1R17_11560 [Flavobacterium sp. xlx-214]|uniref:M56 family metallopeptidase n=1 Tax=unclassified Flavobacterium TaxID=196869 RepID=UPI0013D0633C|nr:MULTISPECIES: M56 family metallopeptidase [unclassified Flavobacterium]MBA5791853.1 hypothetical protein [Flavobacterium sp. xlx-221]QMI83090.1 hypothetical protein H1R17_11560 [Flavobacterium sp. xlx-214]